MKRYLIGMTLLVLWLAGPVSAGVVEDAKEELEKLRRERSVQRLPSPSFPNSNSIPVPRSTDSSEGRSQPASRPVTGKRQDPGSRVTGAPDAASTGVEAEEIERRVLPKQARERARKDRLYSLLGLIFLISLIVGVVAFSKPSEKDI